MNRGVTLQQTPIGRWDRSLISHGLRYFEIFKRRELMNRRSNGFQLPVQVYLSAESIRTAGSGVTS